MRSLKYIIMIFLWGSCYASIGEVSTENGGPTIFTPNESHITLDIASYNKLYESYRKQTLQGGVVDQSLNFQSSLLDNLLSFMMWVLGVIGIFATILTFYGFRSIRDLKIEIKDDLKTKAQSARSDLTKFMNKTKGDIYDELRDELRDLVANDVLSSLKEKQAKRRTGTAGKGGNAFDE